MNSAQSKMQQFTDETLFFIFYGMPGDILQAYAAVNELKKAEKWLKRFSLSISC